MVPLLAAVGACGPARPVVEGTALLDGRPVDGGWILLIPEAGTLGATVGGTLAAGRYRLAGRSSPSVGRHRIEIRRSLRTGRQVPNPANPHGGLVDEVVEAIPARYNADSVLSIDVVPGVNRRDLALWQTADDDRGAVHD